MNYALIFAGGVGSRMNSKARPKQFLEIHGKPIIVHTLEHFEKHSEIDAICVVIVAEWLDYMKSLIRRFNIDKVQWIVEGGETAMGSQYNGLKVIRESENFQKNDIVLIHDGVRPLIDEKLISNCIRGVKQYGSAVTVAPAIETIICTNDNNSIVSTIERDKCQLARAPQSFYVEQILGVHERAIKDGKYDFIDSTSIMLHYGHNVYTVEGPTENIKVTNSPDFYICRALLDARENAQIFGI